MPSKACSAIAQVAASSRRDDGAADREPEGEVLLLGGPVGGGFAGLLRRVGLVTLHVRTEEHGDEQRARGEQQQPRDQRRTRLGLQHLPQQRQVEDVADLAGATYEPRRSSSARVAAVSASHPRPRPLHRTDPGAPLPAGQHEGRAADEEDETGVRDIARKTVETADDSAATAWSDSPTEVFEGAPMEKVKAPETGGCPPTPPGR